MMIMGRFAFHCAENGIIVLVSICFHLNRHVVDALMLQVMFDAVQHAFTIGKREMVADYYVAGQGIQPAGNGPDV